MLAPTKTETAVIPAWDIKPVRRLLEAGLTVGEVVLSRTGPEHTEQLSLLKWD
jgi:hypothetical protein